MIWEEKGRKVCRWMLGGYMLFGGAAAGYHALGKNWYLLAQTLGSMAAVWAADSASQQAGGFEAMGMSTGGGRKGAMSEINVTPLVDVMLVLLIIFII